MTFQFCSRSTLVGKYLKLKCVLIIITEIRLLNSEEKSSEKVSNCSTKSASFDGLSSPDLLCVAVSEYCGLFRCSGFRPRRLVHVSGSRFRNGTVRPLLVRRDTRSTCATRRVWFAKFRGRSAVSRNGRDHFDQKIIQDNIGISRVYRVDIFPI